MLNVTVKTLRYSVLLSSPNTSLKEDFCVRSTIIIHACFIVKVLRMKVQVSLETGYGSIAFFMSVLHNVFLLYHVDIFVSVYKIDKMSFWFGETIFLIWNSLNDPLFGWISDRHYLSGDVCGQDVVEKRLKALQKNGPLLALTFLGFWLGWAYPWLQFVVCLCLYDGFLTLVDLHHSALLADLAVSSETRTKLNSRCSLFAMLGSLSVFVSYMLWHKENLNNFRIFCLVLSVISLLGFLIICTKLRHIHAARQKHFLDGPSPKESFGGHDVAIGTRAMLVKYIKQLSSHKNFLWFAAMNFVQVFHCHFNSNFFPLFLENLLGDSVSPTVASLLLGLSFVAPHINNLYFLALCRKWGVYSVIRMLFAVKLLMALFMLMVGANHIIFLCIFIASNRVFTEGTCKLLSLVVSDLVDEDYVLHSRPQAVSALIFGTAALLSKPGQTFAPLIGTWVLALQTGHDIFQSGHETGSLKATLGDMSNEQQFTHRQGCFYLLVYVPVVCAVLQLACWHCFTLHGASLARVKAARRGQDHSHV